MRNIIFIILFFRCISVISQYSYDLSTNQESILFSKVIGNDSIEYDIISFKNANYTSDIASPLIPTIQKTYILPENIKVTDFQVNAVSKLELGEEFLIYPRQKDDPMHIIPTFIPPDKNVYRQFDEYPGKYADIISDQYYLGYHIITVEYYPVQYIPKTGKLTVYENITINIDSQNYECKTLGCISLRRSNNIKSIIRSIVENPKDVDFYNGSVQSIYDNGLQLDGDRAMPTYQEQIPDYIIITSRDAENGGIKDAFEKLAKWKNKKGVPTRIVYTENIEQNYQGVDLAEKIRFYLSDMRIKYGPGLFILLGGDVNIIPARYCTLEKYSGNNHIRISDMYYCDVYDEENDSYNWNPNGDSEFGYCSSCNTNYENIIGFDNENGINLSPDNIIGRAPVENGCEAEVFVNKVLNYENLNSVEDITYVENILLVGAHNTQNFDFLGQYNLMSAYNFLPENIKAKTWKIFDLPLEKLIQDYDFTDDIDSILIVGDQALNKSAFINALQNGGSSNLGCFHLILHSEHGNPYKIGASDKHNHESLMFSDIENLTNSNHLQIMFTNSCLSNDFSKDCFTERYLNNPTGGGVAIIGNTGFGYTPNKKLFISFLKSLFSNEIFPNGNILGNSFMITRDQGLHLNFQRKNLNLLGDPEMPVWTGTPQYMQLVDTDYNSETNEFYAKISGVSTGDEIRLAVYKEDEVQCFLTKIADGSQIEFTLINVNPHTSGHLYITTSAKNYIPLQDSIPISITGKHLCIVDYIVDDNLDGNSIGNSDAIANAGETIELNVTLKNTGSESVENITAHLTCLNDNYEEYLNIASSSVAYPVINPNSELISNSPFIINSSPVIEENLRLKFKIQILGADNYSGSDEFFFDIYSSKLVTTNKFLTEGEIASEEIVKFNIELSNEGNASATGIFARLHTDDSNLTTYDDSEHEYPDIDEFESETAMYPYSFKVNSNYLPENPIWFNLAIHNYFGQEWNESFNIQDIPPIVENVKNVGQETNIYFEWTPININIISGYNIYRSMDDGNGNDLNEYKRLNVTPLTSSCFTDNNLSPLTIYHYKIAAVSKSGIEGERTYVKAWTSLPLSPNWPVPIKLEEYLSTGTAQLADINNDGTDEIYFHKRGHSTDGALLAFYGHGEEFCDQDNNNTTQEAFIVWPNYDTRATPAIDDINGDGILDIVSITGWEANPCILSANTVYNGNVQNLFEIELPTNRFYREPVLADLDNDGIKEIIIKSTYGGNRFFIYSSQGNLIYSDHNSGSTQGRLAVADLDNDGYKEIIIGYNGSNVDNGIYMYSYENNQWSRTCLFFDINRDFNCSPVIANILDNDEKEIIVVSNEQDISYVNILRKNGSCLPNWSGNLKSIPHHLQYMEFTGISVGDINSDGQLEIVALGNNIIKIWNSHGIIQLDESYEDFEMSKSIPIIADIDEDEELEILFSDGGYLNAINSNDGSIVLGFPLSLLNNETNKTPSVGDIDNDGLNEIIINEGSSVFVWETQGNATNCEWTVIRSQSNNTGEYLDKCSYVNRDIVLIENTEWGSKRLNRNLIIPEGVKLRIKSNAQILTQDEIDIIIKGELFIEESVSIYSECKTGWKGKMIIQNEGALILSNNSSIKLVENGTIFLENDALLEVHPNAQIHLQDPNSCLEIAGNLHIAENTEFKVTGNGYIKFSNPGDDNTVNITCGDGASIRFEGAGIDDKILEIQQKTVRFPQNLSSLEIVNGTVEMGHNKRMQADGNYPITFDHLKITSDNGEYNAHRSFHFYGQADVVIDNCIFEYGYWGLYGKLTYLGSPLTVKNSTFRYNKKGIYIYNKGLDLFNCSFLHNTDIGVHCVNMSKSSKIYSSKIKYNKVGIDYQGSSTAGLSVYACNASNNVEEGIKVGGYLGLGLSCSGVSNNKIGVRTYDGASVYIAGYSNSIVNNNVSISLTAGYLTLAGGYNNLTPKAGGKSLYGTITTFALCGDPVHWDGDHNKYKSSGTDLVWGADYRLAVTGCQPLSKIYLDVENHDHEMCIPKTRESNNGELGASIMNTSATDLSLDELIEDLELQLENENLSSQDYKSLVYSNIEIVETCMSSPLAEVVAVKKRAWTNIHRALDLYYVSIDQNNEDSELLEIISAVVALNLELINDSEITDIDFANYSIDNALLYRKVSNYDEAISRLNALTSAISYLPNELAVAERWLCFIEAEKLAEAGILSADEFFAAVDDCQSTYDAAMQEQMQEFENELAEMDIEEEMHISINPNPNAGNFSVELTNVSESAQVRIVNSFGIPIETFDISCNDQSVSVTGYAAGTYTVYYVENDVVINSETVIVE